LTVELDPVATDLFRLCFESNFILKGIGEMLERAFSEDDAWSYAKMWTRK